MMVWKNRVCFILFCLLQRYIGWIATSCNPIYCRQKYWFEKIINKIYAVEPVGRFRDSKPPYRFNSDDSLPQLRWFACRRIPPTILCLMWLGLALLLASGPTLASTCTSTGGNWATAGTWASCNSTTPQSGDTVVINSGTVILNTSATISGLTINGGALTVGSSNAARTLTVNGNIAVASGASVNVANNNATHTLNVSGNITNNGTFDLQLDNNSLCAANFNGSGTQIIDGNSAGVTEFYNVTVSNNLTINKSGVAITQTGTLSVGNNLTVTAGTINVANSITVTGASSISGTLNHTTTTSPRTFTGDVTINSGGTMAESVAEPIAYGGNLIINNGGVLTESGAATMSIAGSLQNGGTLTASTGVHTFTGTAKTFSGASAIVIPSVTISGTYQNNGTLTVATVLAGSGGLTNSASGILNIGGTSTITTLTATAVGNTVNYTGAAAQTIKATTYDILNTSGAGTKTISAATIVNNALTVTGGTLTNNSTLTVTTALSGLGGLTNGATGILNIGGASIITTLTATAVGNTVNYTGTGQTLKVTAYHHLTLSGGAETFGAITTVGGNLTLSGTATATTGANLTISGNLSIGSGTQFTVGAFNIGVTGTTSVSGTLIHNSATGTIAYTGNITINNGGIWNETAATAISFGGNLQNDGTLTAGTGVHTFSGATKTFSGANAIVIPSVTVSGTYQNNGTLTVATTLAGGGTLTNGAAGILNIGATTVTPTLTATAVGNTVNYTGTGQTLKVTAYYHLILSGGAETFGAITTVAGNLTLSGTATASIGANLTISGNLSVGSGTQFTVGAFNIGVTGTTSVTGTLIHNSATGTKTYTGNVTINNGGIWNETAAAAISFGGNLQNDGTLTAGTGVHTFTGTAKTFSGVSAIVIPSVTVSGTYQSNGTLTVATTLAGGGTLTNGAAGILNIGVATVTPTLTAAAVGNTVNYTGTAAQTIKATTYNILNTSGAGTKTISAATIVNNALTVTGGTLTNNSTLTVTTALSGLGGLTNSATGTLNIGGTSTITTLTATAVGNTVNYTGTGQTIKGTTYHNLTFSGGAESLGADTTVNGTLALGANTLTTGANIVTIIGSCSSAITRSTGFVIGNLRLTFSSGATACTFPIGSGSTYAPITFTPPSASTGGTLTGSTTGSEHPQVATSGIDSTKDVNRYWTLWASGDTLGSSIGSGSTYNATFNFIAGDVDAGATATTFVLGKYDGSAWTLPSPVTATSTSIAVTGIAGPLTSPVSFIAGHRSTVSCTSQTTGFWNASGTWTNCRGGIPLAGDSAIIANSHTVTLNVNTPTLVDLSIASGGTLTNTGSNTITLTGDMSNVGTYSGGSGAITLAGNFANAGSYSAGSATTTLSGNFTNSGTFTASTSTWVFSGSSAQSFTGVTSFNSLTVNNASGVSLNNNVSVTTLLTLTSGSISTGSNILILSANCRDVTSTNGTSWARTSGFVNGNLRLAFPSGSTTCTFPVGSGTTYAPISLVLTASASGTTLTGSTTGSEHPQIATAGIDATKDVNRYWSLWATGDVTTAVTSYGATFTFVTGDLDIGATTSNFIVGKYVGSAWTLPTVGTRASTSTSITGVSGPIIAITGFAAGEAGVADPPCTSPVGMTCVCDNFARSNLNPSTIFGADWSVGHNAGSANPGFGDPIIVSNSLRLTDTSTNVATVATLPGQFPAAGNTITVEFTHYAYGSTANSSTSPCTAANPCGADGIALTLSDSTVTPVAGAYGGSLGYAQKTGINGFAGGWLGVGFDEWGNFANPTEGRVGGTGFTPESVTLRGSGSGSGTGSSNYPFLVSTGTISVSAVDKALSSSRAWGYLYRVTVDASAYTWNSLFSTGVKTAKVKVERDTTGTGNSYVTLPNLDLPDIYTYNTGQAVVPVNWKLSFTGATGSDTNIHEIRGLKICSNSYTPPSGFSILVDNLSPTTCTTASNGKPIVTVSAHDSSGNVITGYTNTVTLGARVSSPSGSNSTSVVWNKVAGSANGTLSGNQYTFAAADNGVAKFYLTDTVAEDIYIAVSENGGTLSTTLSTPVQYRGTAFTIATPDTLGTGVVAGRNHLMSITRSSGCGTDTTYNGAKNLDGWYSIAAGTHPAGAYAPELCATNSGGSCLLATGSCTTVSIAPPSLDANSNYLPALTFTNGVANFCLMTTDVGNYSVNLRDDSNVTVPVTGSSATLTVRPFAVVTSNIKQGAINNPATSDATGTPMVAGTAFQATVAGYLWNSTGDTLSNGLPGVSADFTAITGANIAPSYADTVTLSTRTPFAPATSSDTPAGAGIAGSLTSGSVALTGGSATISTLNYNEVGSFTLKVTPSANYLNSGVDLSTRVAYFTNPDSMSSTSWVGRFRPHHFVMTQGTATPGCGAFTYFGQDGFSSTGFKLTAQNTNNATTQNYAGSYAKLDLTTWSNFGFTATTLPAGSVLSASATAPAGNWNNGVATVTAKHQLSRPTALIGETNVVVQATPIDSDGVTMTAADIGPSTPLRYGRLTLQNAYGSELLALPMSLTAEYWNGNSWITNAADNCTALNAPANGSGLTLNLTSGGTTTAALSNPLVSGDAGLSLAAPGATHTGYVDVVINSPAWLDFNWQGAGNTDPIGRATFGIYKGNSRFIYIRELY
jgi:MSHA biogenesis protein MshQ